MCDTRFDWDATISHGRYELDVNRPRFLANKVNDYFLGPQFGLDPFFGVYPVYNLDMDRFFSPIDPDTLSTLNTTVRTEAEIGRAHVCTPVTNAQLVCCLLLAQTNILLTFT